MVLRSAAAARGDPWEACAREVSVSRVSFAVSLFPYDRWTGVEAMARGALHAEAAGFSAITIQDHVIMPVKPGVEPVTTEFPDPLVLAAYLATLTERVRFVFSVLVVPYRPPIQLAKQIATLDAVSGGRITLGVGIGWLKGEFRTLGIPFAERADRCDESLRAMKVLWTQRQPEFQGHWTQFSNIAFSPRCVQKPHVPLWLGGGGQRSLARAVELGDGWIPMVGGLPELRRGADWIREQLEARGRDPRKFDFSYGLSLGEPDPQRERAVAHASGSEQEKPRIPSSPAEIIDRIGELEQIGFRHLSLNFYWRGESEFRKQVDWLGQYVLPAYAR
jgi:probable F420-dependent oxidoreductase